MQVFLSIGLLKQCAIFKNSWLQNGRKGLDFSQWRGVFYHDVQNYSGGRLIQGPRIAGTEAR
jgi:hypothetical protein